MSMIAQGSWHSEGLFMGMHWVWWLLWIATLVILGWAFWRLRVERREARREAERSLQAADTRDTEGGSR